MGEEKKLEVTFESPCFALDLTTAKDGSLVDKPVKIHQGREKKVCVVGGQLRPCLFELSLRSCCIPLVSSANSKTGVGL